MYSDLDPLRDLEHLVGLAFELKGRVEAREYDRLWQNQTIAAYGSGCLVGDAVVRVQPASCFYLPSAHVEWNPTATAALTRVLLEAAINTHYFADDMHCYASSSVHSLTKNELLRGGRCVALAAPSPAGGHTPRGKSGRISQGPSSMGAVPANRVRALNSAPPDAAGGHLLYWMTACRRTAWNYGLQRALEWVQELRKPLLVLETLTCGGGRWDSDRHRQFVIDGMTDNARAFQGASARYSAYAGPSRAAVRKTVQALAERACVLLTDDHPLREATAETAAVAKAISIRVESVDSNGLLPIRAAGRAFPTAYLLRRYLQKTLAEQLQTLPEPHPLAALPGLRLPGLPGRHQDLLSGSLGEPGAVAQVLRGVPAGHAVLPVASVRGGAAAATGALRRFLDERLYRYQAERDHPDSEATSQLSPYLSHGHISAHEVLAEILSREGRSPRDLPVTGNGKRSGWWGVSASAEAFLDQLVTWRELGLNTCVYRSDYDQFSSLPAWAQQTLLEHQSDVRPVIYSYEEMRTASTHDPLWNAAQRQLVREGRMHNYLRMLWGKRILEWTPTPQEALEAMVELNNTYALDAEDPNSYTGILWVLGRHDRPWGPRRPIFGTVRYMSSERAARKLHVKGFLQRYGA